MKLVHKKIKEEILDHRNAMKYVRFDVYTIITKRHTLMMMMFTRIIGCIIH